MTATLRPHEEVGLIALLIGKGRVGSSPDRLCVVAVGLIELVAAGRLTVTDRKAPIEVRDATAVGVSLLDWLLAEVGRTPLPAQDVVARLARADTLLDVAMHRATVGGVVVADPAGPARLTGLTSYEVVDPGAMQGVGDRVERRATPGAPVDGHEAALVAAAWMLQRFHTPFRTRRTKARRRRMDEVLADERLPAGTRRAIDVLFIRRPAPGERVVRHLTGVWISGPVPA